MSDQEQIPPHCEFELDKLVRKVDEVLSSDIGVIDAVVSKIRSLIEEKGCVEGLDRVNQLMDDVQFSFERGTAIYIRRKSPTSETF